MSRMYRKLISLCIVLSSSLFFSQIALAEERAVESTKEIALNEILQLNMAETKPINHGGYIYDIQKVDPQLLAQDVEKLRAAFIRRQHELTQLVENREFGAGDALITVVMPGGLLYAGYKKQQLEKAKTSLSVVTAEITELSNDLMAFQGQDREHPILLAQLP